MFADEHVEATSSKRKRVSIYFECSMLNEEKPFTKNIYIRGISVISIACTSILCDKCRIL